MLGTINQISLEQLKTLLNAPWKRRIREVHIHHTWRPRHADWRGKATVESMRRYHMQTNGWSDIAQHLTIGPDGSLWTGRHLDRSPASATGFNGSSVEGPFMIEMVGDFDLGQDTFGGEQAKASYAAVAYICDQFGLTEQQIRFHSEFNAGKSCPGTAINQIAFRKEVTKQLGKRDPALARSSSTSRYLARLASPAPKSLAHVSDEGEPVYSAQQASWFEADGKRGLFGPNFDENDQAVFRKHVVNLSKGELSDSGDWCNNEQDIERLADNIKEWASKHNKKKARILFWAHGGLVTERNALEHCLDYADWWLENDVYPVFFVWETGFFEIFNQFPAQGSRDLTNWTDPLLEATLGPTIGKPAWDRMKESAVLASVDSGRNGAAGGASFFVTTLLNRLKTLLTVANAPTLEFHAVGHSAGAIFHAHFVPMLIRKIATDPDFSLKKEPLSSLTYLAPAMRGDLYLQQINPQVASKKVGALNLFTMRRDAELEDSVAAIYRKSLLYFVRNACEGDACPPILGLQESIDAHPQLRQALGLDPAMPVKQVTAIFGPTKGTGNNDASDANEHGGFDNDPATLNSVLGRILGSDAILLPNAGKPQRQPPAFPNNGSVDLPTGRGNHLASRDTASGTTTGTKRALCIGINQYEEKPLSGCVADATRWSETLAAFGFDTNLLLDTDATRGRILTAIEHLLSQSNAGDVAVIQFAGHGTQVTDLSRDESDGLDEAWVAADYQQGGLVLDDDLGRLFDRYQKRGFELVLFTDCCHSGTSTRAMATGNSLLTRPNSRYLSLSASNRDAFVQRYGAQARLADRMQDTVGWEIHFAACQDHQSAMEHAGRGDFTTAACDLLENLNTSASYGQLADKIREAFRNNFEQMPNFRSQTGTRARKLFGSASREKHSSQANVADNVPSVHTMSGTCSENIAQRLDQLTEAISKLTDEVRRL